MKLKITKLNLRDSELKKLYLPILLLTASLLPGSLFPSLWMDDYPFLWGIVSKDQGTLDFVYGSARPILAMLFSLASNFSVSLYLFSYLKLLGFLGVIFTFLTIWNRWKQNGFNNYVYIIAAAGLCLPTFQSYTFWASAFTYSWSPGIAIVALTLWERHKNSLNLRLIAPILFALSFLLYPPGAFFIFGLLAAEVSLNQHVATPFLFDSTKRSIVLVSTGTLLSFSVFIGYLFIWNLEANHRNEIVGPPDLPGKIAWYLTRVVVTSLRPFQISSPTPTEAGLSIAPVFLILLFGFFRTSRLFKQQIFIKASLILFLLALSSMPFLLLRENQFEFRFFPGQMWGTFFIVSFIFVKSILSIIVSQKEKLLLYFTFFFLAIFIVVKTNIVYYEIIWRPYNEKTIYLLNKVTQCLSNSTDGAIEYQITPTKWIFRKNLGSYSIFTDSAYDWVILPELKLLGEKARNNTIFSNSTMASSFPYKCNINISQIVKRIKN